MKRILPYAAIGTLGLIAGRCAAPACPPCQPTVCEQSAETQSQETRVQTCAAVAPCKARAVLRIIDGVPTVETEASAEPKATATSEAKTFERVQYVQRIVAQPGRVETPKWLWSVGVGVADERLFLPAYAPRINAQVSVSREFARGWYSGASADTSGAVFIHVGGAF